MLPHAQKAHPDIIVAAEREQEAIKLRLKGLSYADIADRMDMSVSGARSCVERALRRTTEETTLKAKELRSLELARLDALQSAVWDGAMCGNLDAIKVALKISERRSKLVGMDAPNRLKLDVDKLSDAELINRATNILGGAAAALAGAAAARSEDTRGRASTENTVGALLPAYTDAEAEDILATDG